jgi:hypothetical protein
MGATRQRLATTPHRTRCVAVVLLACKQIVSIPSKAFPPIALPQAAKGWMNAVRGPRAKALSFVIASALCASPAWSAKRAAKSNRAPAVYFPIPCDDPAVLSQIAAEYRARHGASDLTAVGIFHARTRKSTREYWPHSDMPRRFCEGTITPPSGAERLGFYPSEYPIYYAIIANPGSYEVEWCVVGLDHAWPIDRRCLLARP